MMNSESVAALTLIEAYKDAIKRLESNQSSINHLEKMGTSDDYFKTMKKVNAGAIEIIKGELASVIKRAHTSYVGSLLTEKGPS